MPARRRPVSQPLPSPSAPNVALSAAGAVAGAPGGRAPAGPTTTAAEATAGDAGNARIDAEQGRVSASTARAPFWASLAAYPVFRRFWVAAMAGSLAQWMQMVALGWLALTLTDSASFVGVVSFVAGAPFLVVAPLGGSLIDRFERRSVMLVCQAAAALVAVGIAAVVIAGSVQPWHLLVAGFLNGTLQAMLSPTQQSLIPALVERRSLTNAIALMAAAQQMTRIAGPGLAGIVIGTVGEGEAFLLQAVALVAAFALVRSIALPAREPGASPRGALAGIELVLRRPDLRGLFLIAALPALLIFPYLSFLNVFARDVLQVGAGGLAILLAVSGAGALVGSVVVAGLDRVEGIGRWLLVGTLAYGLVIMAVAGSRTLWLTLPLLFCGSCIASTFMSANNAAIQHRIADDIRGRVMGAYMLTFGLMPLGALPLGLLGQRIGVPTALFAFAAACTGLAVLVGLTNPALRRA